MTATIKKLIGCEEWCSFPSLGIAAIKARVDSGAKTSCIHAMNIRVVKREGVRWVKFDIHPLQKNRRTHLSCEAKLVDRRVIKSSSGDTQKRVVIAVPMTLGDDTWEVQLTLTNRDSMGYRMLLGREAMVGRVIIDPELQFCMGNLSDSEALSQY
ncbi:ATP-dependent zinc protease family protein [Teredinibacter waterburyi]|jgi:SSU ribosomal protein S6P modification protein|uniref:ATP-dependent zinc protease family protein n=1 Tax=Teredinibacter waterburyi TaxID=1500538 RepID=UPI00165FCB56|nr:RimK/LysX family protein [Teredinibacter waterburyi]